MMSAMSSFGMWLADTSRLSSSPESGNPIVARRMKNLSSLTWVWVALIAGVCAPWGRTEAGAQVDSWRLGSGGVTWDSEAEVQVGAVSVEGGLQPVQIPPGVNLTHLLSQFGLQWQNGPPEEFTVGGLPHTWSNSAYFNQIKGPLLVVDGNAATSTENVFKSSGNPAGSAFFLDLGTRYPVNRVRFYPPENDPDGYLRAFDVSTSSGDDYDASRRPNYTRVCESASIEEGKSGRVDRVSLRLFFTDELKMAFLDAGEEPLLITLYNQQGQEVFHKNYPETPSILKLRDHRIAMLPVGIYFLKIVKGNEHFEAKKLVKIR